MTMQLHKVKLCRKLVYGGGRRGVDNLQKTVYVVYEQHLFQKLYEGSGGPGARVQT